MNDEKNSAEPEANWEFSPESQQSPVYEGDDFSQEVGVPLPELEPVSWTASEYVSHEKSTTWFFALFAFGAAAALIIYLVVGDILAAVATLIGCLAMSIYAGRKPSTKTYTVDETGIHIDEIAHPYSKFRSFSVVEEGAIDSIWLKPLKRVSPVVVMYFSPEEEQQIVDVIANFLPHEQRELDAVDRFSKRIRF